MMKYEEKEGEENAVLFFFVLRTMDVDGIFSFFSLIRLALIHTLFSSILILSDDKKKEKKKLKLLSCICISFSRLFCQSDCLSIDNMKISQIIYPLKARYLNCHRKRR